MIKQIGTSGMGLVEIPKDITIKELKVELKTEEVFLWMNRKKREEGILANKVKLIKVGENEKNYLYQEMR